MDTDQSLLHRAKSNVNSDAWTTLITIYKPLIAGWVVRAGVEPQEVGDITQEVFRALSQDLPNFEHNGRKGAFRNWLKMTAIFRCRRYWAAKSKRVPTSSVAPSELLNELEEPNSPLSEQWNREHDEHVIEKLLEQVRAEFDSTTFRIFERYVLNEEQPKSLASEMGIDVGQVYKSKFRVMSRLRELARAIVDVPFNLNEFDDSKH